MKKPANSNIYNVNERAVRELYADYIAGPCAPLTCVVSSSPLNEQARTALEKSLPQLGYGQVIDYVLLRVDDIALADRDLFLLLEGLDPLVLIATDAVAIAALEKAYRGSVKQNTSGRLFGRSIAAFQNLEVMMDSSEKKQKAWAILKGIARSPQ